MGRSLDDQQRARRDFSRAVRAVAPRERIGQRGPRADAPAWNGGHVGATVDGDLAMPQFVMGHPTLGCLTADFDAHPHWEL